MRNLEPISSGQIASTNAIEQIERLQRAVETVIKGKPEAIRLAIVTLIAGGHLLVEDVPGVGKTTVALDMAAVISKGYEWPDGSIAEKGRVLIMSAEDDAGDTLSPRLRAACASLENVEVYLSDGEIFSLKHDLVDKI